MKKNYTNVLKYFYEEPFEKYYNETAEKIIFTSESLFTKKFIKDLKSILNRGENSGKTFKKLSSSNKKKIVSELDDLLQVESMWKNLVKNSKFNSQKILEIFPEEAEQFLILYKNGFFAKKSDKPRQENMKGSGKTKLFLTGLLRFIKKDMSYILNGKGLSLEYTDKDLENLVKTISPTLLFQDLVKISMKKAYDTNINIESNNPRSFHTKPLNSNFLKAKKTEIRYPAIKYIVIFLTSHLLNDLSEKKLLVNNEVDYIISILKIFEVIYQSEKTLKLDSEKTNKWYLLGIDITEILLYMFEQTDVIKYKHAEKIKGTNKTNKIYIFNHKLDNSISFSENLPRIIPPVKAETSKCAHNWISPVKKGDFNVQLSKEALSALNNAQKKEFKINSRYLNLLKEVDENRNSALEFPTRKNFQKTRQNFEEWSNSSWNSIFDVMLYRVSRGIIRVKKLDNQRLHPKILRICKISHLESHANTAKNQIRHDLIKKRTMRQLLLTSITIGDLYQDYPLFYGTLLDFRLRMYPLQYLLSRTTGYLKNLLEESKKKRLTKSGIKNMLEAYYSPDIDLSSTFRKVSIARTDKMFKFFEENRMYLEDKPLYFELLDQELLHLSKEKSNVRKTALQLEIDQVGSGPTFVALLTQNKALAEKCNLLEGEFICIYSYILKETIKFFKENNNFDLEIKNINHSKAYKLLTQNRKAQKYALMCFFYNEEHLSRTNRWKEQFREEFGTTADDIDYLVLSKFSLSYDRFMNNCFPKLSKQLTLLNDSIMILVKQNLPAKIETLDGCIISWDFANTTEIKRSIYNPVSGTHEQVKVRIKKSEFEPSNTRVTRHKRSFRPNFIHSIDAAIMRIFMQKFLKKTKRRLNHLHDCVMLHPNDTDIFYDIVKDIFCSPAMSTLANDLFFSRIKKDLVGEPLNKVLNFEKQFKKNMDNLNITKENFDPRKCYRFEGTK